MFELVKNVIADKETTCKPKRTPPTISFCLILYDVGILMKFYNAKAIHIVPLIGLTQLFRYYENPSVICGRGSSHISRQNE